MSTIGDTNLTRLNHLAYDVDDHILYGLNQANQQSRLVSIDINTAAVTMIATLDLHLNFLAIDSVNDRLFSAYNQTLVSIDPHSGAVTFIGPSNLPGSMTGFVYVVPEVSSLSLIGAGVLVFGVVFCRSRRAELA